MSATDISVTRCLDGRLKSAYPASRHDVELRVQGAMGADLSVALAREVARIFEGDPQCRKIVYAAPAGDLATIRAAEAAGFRYVVDVDIADAGRRLELSLLVREPQFVTRVDMDPNRVPQS
jgi:hypothetical protein